MSSLLHIPMTLANIMTKLQDVTGVRIIFERLGSINISAIFLRIF